MNFIQNLDKKRFLIIAGIFLALILFVWFLLNPLGIKQHLPEKPETLKERALQTVEFQAKNEQGFINASIVSKPEEHFQITYQGEIDRFDILIQTGGREDAHYLTKEEVLHVREVAESYFLKEVLKTERSGVACKLNVWVSTIGYGDFSIKSSPLSVCQIH